MSDKREWSWWYSRYEYESYSGPFPTREDAISEGRVDFDGDAFIVAEATNAPLKLSDWIEADRLIERAEDSVFETDRVSGEWDDEVFHATKEQETDLIARVKAACDDWQAAHGLVFTCCTFEAMRNIEQIPAAILENDDE